jgi:acyl-CoA reductase-like NAD-dependent aldehyde dehydrogenase
MLEKFAPAFLAGMPSVVKPASQTSYLTELIVRRITESGLLPEGSLSLLCAGPGGLLDSLTSQDTLSFTGSAATARMLRTHPAVAGQAVPFNAEADSLNCSVLGPDVARRVGDDPAHQWLRRRLHALADDITHGTGASAPQHKPEAEPRLVSRARPIGRPTLT